MTPNGERIASLETEVKELKAEISEYKQQTSENLKSIDHKLDTLIGLRNKGAGVFWFVSGLVALLGVFYQMFWRHA